MGVGASRHMERGMGIDSYLDRHRWQQCPSSRESRTWGVSSQPWFRFEANFLCGKMDEVIISGCKESDSMRGRSLCFPETSCRIFIENDRGVTGHYHADCGQVSQSIESRVGWLVDL